MTEPVGPVYAGGFETIAAGSGDERYEILYFPDLHNSELQAEGKAPVYYWLPNAVRIARKGDTGDYKFRLLHFVGVLSEDTTVGVAGRHEVTGGVLSVTVTSAPPLAVLEQAHRQLTDRMKTDSRKYWSWHTPAQPRFQPVIISDSKTSMSSLSPRLDGSLPAETHGGTRTLPAKAPSKAVGAPVGAASGASGAGASASAAPAVGAPPGGRASADGADLRPRLVTGPQTVRADRDVRADRNLDMWYMKVEGGGSGSINPAGEHAYTALCGALPTAILWQGFHGAYSPISVSQTLNLKMWSQTLRIKIRGNWDRVFQHFSAHAKGRAWWFDADIKAEFNNLRIGGGITVEIEIDGTVPSADKMREEVDKRVDLIVQKFTEQAKARIFDPAPPDVRPAEATSGGGVLGSLFGFGGGFALKYRRDETKLELNYDETRLERFNLPMTISSTLEGFYNDIKADPQAEQKYFSTLYLDDWDRKISHTVKPVVNWPSADGSWAGDPVAFLGVQIGYPSARGDIQWTPHVFQSTDTGPATSWQPAFAKKKADDVVGAPAGWTPDISYVKRTVHFTEPPGEVENPYHHVFVEKEIVDLDPGPNGTATNEKNIEVRADNAGKFDLGPISLDAWLEDAKQTVDVEFQALGKTHDGKERPIHAYRWKHTDQDVDRRWTIFTGQQDFKPEYRYRCVVTVQGSLFSRGMKWTGPWVESSGIGVKTIRVPLADDEGVQVRALRDEPREFFAGTATKATRAEGKAAGPPPARAAKEREEPAEPVSVGPPPRRKAAERAVGGFSVSPSQPEAEPVKAGYGARPVRETAAPSAKKSTSAGAAPARKAREAKAAEHDTTSYRAQESAEAAEAEAAEPSGPPVTAGWTSTPPKSVKG